MEAIVTNFKESLVKMKTMDLEHKTEATETKAQQQICNETMNVDNTGSLGLIQRLTFGCVVPPTEEVGDPGKMWVLEEFGCLQKKKKTMHSPCTVKGKCLQGTREGKVSKRNHEWADIPENARRIWGAKME
jgi:hypothetical protein